MPGRLWRMLALVVVTVVLGSASSLATPPPPIKIGLLYSLSGMAAMIMEGTVYAHEIAAEEINTRGGLLGGRKIEYVVRDDRFTPEAAVKEFRRMVQRDKVDLVMGVNSSDVALAVSQAARDLQVLFVDAIAQTATLTEEHGHQYVVRTNTNSTGIGRTAAWAAAKGPWKTYYFIGPDHTWGHQVHTTFWEFLQRHKQDVQNLGEIWLKPGERDVSAHLTTILHAKPDAVFSALWGADLIAFVKQARTQRFFEQVQFISTGAGDLDILKPLGPEMPEGIMATFFYAFDLPAVGQGQDHAHFVAAFKQRAGYEPKARDVIGYISTHMIAEAIARAGSTATEVLIKALRGGKFTTLLGDVTIRDFDGQATFGCYTGFTSTHPHFPFKRLKNVIRAEGEEVLRTQAEVEQVRAAYRKKP